MEILHTKDDMSLTKYTVRTSNHKMVVDVPDFFDNPHIEAATIFIERLLKYNQSTLSPIIAVKDNITNIERIINTYIVLQNAGKYHLSELVRQQYISNHKIDLANEPIIST